MVFLIHFPTVLCLSSIHSITYVTGMLNEQYDTYTSIEDSQHFCGCLVMIDFYIQTPGFESLIQGSCINICP